MFRKSVALAVAMVLGTGAASGFAQPAPVVTINAPRKAKRGLFGGLQFVAPMTYGHKGAGITMAQQQRASKRARNVKRHRAHVRG